LVTNKLKSFGCAAAIEITEKGTPTTYRLLRRSLLDFGLGTYAAKQRYRRPRPFMSNGSALCTPNEEQALRADGSDPSGHSADGDSGGAWCSAGLGSGTGRAPSCVVASISEIAARSVTSIIGRVTSSRVGWWRQRPPVPGPQPAFCSDFEAAPTWKPTGHRRRLTAHPRSVQERESSHTNRLETATTHSGRRLDNSCTKVMILGANGSSIWQRFDQRHHSRASRVGGVRYRPLRQQAR
jgi:hypothetical protein